MNAIPASTPPKMHGGFIEHLADKVSLDPSYIQPGYEDTFYYLWRERRLPVNVDPFESELDDEMERMRLRRVFDAGLSQVTGYVLPIARERDVPMQAPTWVSGPWFFRDGRMYLIPGDSPMGYRLPLESLPWVSAGDYPYQHPHDPFGPPAPLRQAMELRMQYRGEPVVAKTTEGKSGAETEGTGTAAGTSGQQPQPASRRAASPLRGSGVQRCALKRAIRRVRQDLTSKRNRSEAARACCMCSCRR